MDESLFRYAVFHFFFLFGFLLPLPLLASSSSSFFLFAFIVLCLPLLLCRFPLLPDVRLHLLVLGYMCWVEHHISEEKTHKPKP